MNSGKPLYKKHLLKSLIKLHTNNSLGFSTLKDTKQAEDHKFYVHIYIA